MHFYSSAALAVGVQVTEEVYQGLLCYLAARHRETPLEELSSWREEEEALEDFLPPEDVLALTVSLLPGKKLAYFSLSYFDHQSFFLAVREPFLWSDEPLVLPLDLDTFKKLPRFSKFDCYQEALRGLNQALGFDVQPQLIFGPSIST